MDDKNKPPVMETASATTSSENNKSGSFAYVLTGVVAGCAIVLSLVTGGCVAAIVATSAANYQRGASSLDDPYSGNSDLKDFEDLINQYTNDYASPYGSNNGRQTTSGTCSVAEALDYDLSLYTVSIGSDVRASSYANTPSEVRDFVREVVNKDEEYANQIVQCLHEAAHDESIQQDKIAEAIALCDDAAKAIEDVEVPSVEGDEGGRLKDSLGSAKTESSKRWEATKQEIELLHTTDDIKKQDLWDLDDKTMDAVSKAAEALTVAMEESVSK